VRYLFVPKGFFYSSFFIMLIMSKFLRVLGFGEERDFYNSLVPKIDPSSMSVTQMPFWVSSSKFPLHF
jgi:hypothetical protein